MAANYKTIGNVEVTAVKFDPLNPPAMCEADGGPAKHTDSIYGWKVKTRGGYVFPDADDWIVSYGGGEYFLIDDTEFLALFTTV